MERNQNFLSIPIKVEAGLIQQNQEQDQREKRVKPASIGQGLNIIIKIKKPMTDRAVLLAIRELEKLKGEGHEPKQVLEQSILNSWQGLFPLRDSKPGKVDWAAWEKD